MQNTFARIVHASKYFDGAKGLLVEVVQWDHSSLSASDMVANGDFAIEGYPAFYNLKNAKKWAKREYYDMEIHIE